MTNKKEKIEEGLKLVKKVVVDWQGLHVDLNDAIKLFEEIGFKEGYKIACEISDQESRLIEEAQEAFQPLLEKLKEESKKFLEKK